MSIVATSVLGLPELASNYFATTIWFLLEPTSFFCFHHLWNLLEPVFCFATTVLQICWNQCRWIKWAFWFVIDEGEQTGGEHRRRATGAADLATYMREGTRAARHDGRVGGRHGFFLCDLLGCWCKSEKDNEKTPSNDYAWGYPRAARRPAELGPVDRRLSLPFTLWDGRSNELNRKNILFFTLYI